MADIKHVGRIRGSGRKCIVVFRTLPNDAFNCLVVLTESLPASYHDALISAVEGINAQASNELSDFLARMTFPDGTTMLPSLHRQGLLTKVPTDRIEMTPNSSSSIVLADLNQLIAEQKGVSVQDLAVKDARAVSNPNVEIQEVAQVNEMPQTQTEPSEPGILSDADLAAKYRNDAEMLLKEAANLQQQADALDPKPVIKKKVATKKTTAKKTTTKKSVGSRAKKSTTD